MGKYKDFFCCPIPDMLLTVGVVMTILSALMTVLGFVNFIIIIEEGSEKINIGVVITTMIGIFIYGASTFVSCCICCFNKSPDLSRFLVIYCVFLVLILIVASADAYFKFEMFMTFSILYILYAIVAALSLFVALIARQDLVDDSITATDQFNLENDGRILTTEIDGLPKFPVVIQIEKTEG